MTNGFVGILGGTFNPIHTGHLRAAEEALKKLHLSKVLLVPSSVPALKFKGTGENFIAPAQDRAYWVELAIRDNPRLQLCKVELQREGPSYTIDTLRILSEQFPSFKLIFIVGSDAFRNFDNWFRADEVLSMADFAVLVRPPELLKSLRNCLPPTFHSACTFSEDESSATHLSGSKITLIEIEGIEVSSSDIRRRIFQGRPIHGLIPELSREAIEASGCFSKSTLQTHP